MNQENSADLMAIYPALFSGQDPREPFPMFGFECGDGWFELLKECIENIKAICERDGLNVKTRQIKEKYATLRFYIDNHFHDIDEAIEHAERRSAETCEACGQPGIIRKKGYWVYVSCEACIR